MLAPGPATDRAGAAGGGTVTFGAPMVVYSERPASMYTQLQVGQGCCTIDGHRMFHSCTPGLAPLLSKPAKRLPCLRCTSLMCPCIGFFAGDGEGCGGLRGLECAAAAVPQPGEQCGCGAAAAGHQPGSPARAPGDIRPHDTGIRLWPRATTCLVLAMVHDLHAHRSHVPLWLS